MLISRQFWILAAGVILITLSGSLIAIVHEWDILSDKRSSIDLLAIYRLALVVAEKVSRECDQVNSVLGTVPPQASQAIHSLVEARKQTDEAISALATALPFRNPDRSTVVELNTKLAAARRRVDVLMSMPTSRRHAQGMNDALQQMLGLVDILQPALSRIQTPLLIRAPEISYQIAGTRLLTEFREYAGRLGSDLGPAVAHGVPLTQSQEGETERVTGHILEIYDLLKIHATNGTTDPELLEDMNAVQNFYLGHAWKLVSRVRAASRSRLPYPMTIAEFTKQYVSAMEPIVALRDSELQLADRRISASIDQAKLSFGWVIGSSMLALALELMLIRTFRRKVIEPVEEVSAAFGRTDPGGRGDHDDIVRLRSGSQRLRAKEAENLLLEMERQDALNFISHDVRTPIASIIALTECPNFESNVATDKSVRQYIARQARHALSLVDQYLQLARLHSRIESDEFQPINIVDVLTEVIDDAWAPARCQEVSIVFDHAGVDAWVSGARLTIFRIFSNLVHNAIKFSFTNREVHVGLSRHGENWTISVRDSGRGIAGDHLSKLFRPFYRAPSANGECLVGSGLGLAYVRIAVTQLGGTVTVSSSLNVGTVFLVTLPAVQVTG
ncbi:sensor histidine kinase [Burkholderia ubonensis]|uniref:sensor histidine kinase n=1 Tax=Burkholderia ubonensis TaxID=101571 RepID=UPI00358EB796